MSDPIEIPIVAPFDSKGVDAAIKAFERLGKAETQAAQASAKVAGANATVAQSAQRVAQAHNQTAVSAQKVMVAQNQAAISAQKLATAQAQTAGALIKNEAAMSKAALAALRLEQAQDRAAQGGSSLGKALSGLQSAAGAAGFAIGAQQVLAFAKSSVDLANSTKQADSALRALAGTPALYGEALAAARQQQILFGGSLQENISGIQGLITVSRDSGIELTKLIDLSQRLAVKDPSQGAAGARIALQEAFSGDPTSLAKRYEVPKAALAALRDESTSSAEKLAILDTYLNKIGITSEVASGSVTKSAQQINMLGASAERAQIALGNMIAPAVGEVAEQVATGIDRLMQGTDGLKAAWEQLALGAQATTAAENARVAALQAGATSAEASAAATAAYAEVVNAATQAQQGGTTGGAQWGAATTEAGNAAIVTTAAIGEMLTKTLEEAAAKEEASTKAAMFAEAQQTIANLGGAVNAGLTTSAEGALILADRYGIAYSQALLLIDAQARIAGGQARLAGQKAQTRELVPGGVGVSSPGKRGQSDADILATVKQTTDEITAVGVRAQPIRTAAVKAGGGARASAEQSAADKIKQIAQDTAAKLVSIDERAAEARAKAMQSLAAAIGTTSADMVASQEANDLELVGASEDRVAELTAREQAEAQARIASIEAVKEARAIADAGDAEQAQAVLEQRQQQIQAQQSLDEEYAKRRAELAGDPAATEALKTQYDEATAALADATQVRIDLAAQEAQQKADALAAEKAAVLDAASAQAAALGTTGDAADTAAGRVRALTDAINSIPEAKTVTINVVEKGGSGGASSSSSGGGAPSSSGGGGGDSAKMAGGGILTGVTNGPMTVTLGDNPGGREAYAISATPLSGAGHSTATAGHLRLAGGTADADAIRRLEDANRRQIPPTASGGGAPARSGGGGGSGGGDAKASVDEALKNEKEALQLIKDVADLRKELRKGVPPPIAASLIADLTAEAARISQTVSSGLVPTTKDQVEALGNWRELVGDSVGILKDVGSLSSDMFRDYQRPSREQIGMFVGDAQEIARQVDQAARIYQSDALENAETFSEGVGATFSAIGDGLRVIDQLRFSDLTVDTASLQTFQDSSLAILNTADILAARADQIDPGALASLGNATAAINAQAEALINLSAVPFGNLGQTAAGFGGGGSTTSIVFEPGSIVASPGMDISALADLVAQKIGNRVSSVRR